jgi:hypothetical protein
MMDMMVDRIQVQKVAGTWRMYGECMENVWRLYGDCMETVWRMYGECMETVWRMYGGGSLCSLGTYSPALDPQYYLYQ